jgi:type VI protein secretion system component Hcp
MPAEWCDGFLQLVKGGQAIKGETTDKAYSGAIEILSFKIGSMSGFTDTEGFYAVQDARQRSDVAFSRAYSNDESEGIATLFASDAEMDAFEGTDLSKVDACKFTITKEMDLSSPDLFRAYCSTQDLKTRDVFNSGTVTLRKATGGSRAVFLTYSFEDLVVVGYSLDIGADAKAKETVTISFAKVRAEYKPQKATGELGAVVKGGWDFIERTSWS